MRGDFVLGLAFCVVAGPAPAWAETASWTWSGRLPQPPPEEFAGPYEGKLTVNRVPLAEIPDRCRNFPRVLGCAYWDQYSHAYCTVYIPNDVPERLEAAILTHELGHCKGWKHRQPDQPAAKIKGLNPDDRLFDGDTIKDIATRKARENPVCQTEPKPEACP